MATAGQSDDDKRLELFTLIWLDSNVHITTTEDTEQSLRSIINHLKKFEDVKQCQQYIEQRSHGGRIVLIVSGRFGRELVPSIHKLQQVISIYVYCVDKKSNIEWSSKFSKVKGVVVEFDELISCIKKNQKTQKNIEEPLAMNIFPSGKSTTELNGEFVFTQVLIDYLLTLKSTQSDKNELFDLCKVEYQGNNIELNNLRKFQKEYSPNKVLWWYTSESFFYKTLNTALRTQNIHLIFLFRSFISDIYCQLRKCQSKNILRVYRCQMISTDELKTLKSSMGQFISINSFFSTSANQNKALSFLDNFGTLENLEGILFQIEADPKMVTTKPFADISQLSAYPDESEVLFMIGSIFRLKNISYDNNRKMHIVQLTLCSDTEHDFKSVILHMKQQIENEEPNLRTLGKLLCQMGKHDLAEKYFKRLLEQLPVNNPLVPVLYKDLSDLGSRKGDLNMTVEWLQKSLQHNAKYPMKNDSYIQNSDYDYIPPTNSYPTNVEYSGYDSDSTTYEEPYNSNNYFLQPCPDNVNCLYQYDNDESGREHNSRFSHPCRFSELCRNQESDRTHYPRSSPMCKYDGGCNHLNDPFHRAAYRHRDLPDFLIPCRYQTDCYNKSYKHLVKYSHGEQVYEMEE